MGFLGRRPRNPEYETAEIYDGLRGRALALTASELGVDPDETPILAAIMELGYPEAVASLVAIADGAASLYFSNGGGTIGAGEHESVARVARQFVGVAAQHSQQLQEVAVASLPARGSVRFQLVTDRGLRSAEAPEEALGEGSHPLSPLFHHGHALIAAIREATEQGT